MKAGNVFMGKLRYKFDNLMSRGPITMITLLGILSLIVVFLGGGILYVFKISSPGSETISFIEGSWQSLMRTLDAGTMGGDEGWKFRAVAFLVTLGGIFIISTLIGILSSAIENKLDELRKGRSFIYENNHTLILGWSSKIFSIIEELVIAGENQRKSRIAILADKDKVEMEEEIRSKISDFKNMKIICRSGSPNDLHDLHIVNPYEAKSIIILSSDSTNNDTHTIKTILAITNNPDRKKEDYHIVAEIKDIRNLEVAQMVGRHEVELILTDDIISRIMVQTCRQSGLSMVYQELMDFDGAEIYFTEEPTLLGKSFKEVLFSYKSSTVIGIQYTNGIVKLNPSMEYRMMAGDKIITIAEDDDKINMESEVNYTISEEMIVSSFTEKRYSERIILIGWNERASKIIQELNRYVEKGSFIKVICSFDKYEDEITNASNNLENLELSFEFADTTKKSVIDNLNITSYDSVLVLCYKDDLDLQEADAKTLVTLLHLRRICELEDKNLKIVSEMLDLRNRELAEVTKADDFIVSDKLISLMMSQVSENKMLMQVFTDLMDSDGSEIYLKPITNYITPNKEVDFYTLLESAASKGEVAIGYRIEAHSHDSSKAYGVAINPNKAKKINFSHNDKLIVISEN